MINLSATIVIIIMIVTEWSTIQGVIMKVISKSVECEVQGGFEITSMSTL